jgi:hypothetical protein
VGKLVKEMDTEAIRRRFRPDKIRLLFIGESPPANGHFFYVKSGMTTFTSRAFEKAHGVTFKNSSDFLEYFKACGCFLDDLSKTPVDNLPKLERERQLRENVNDLSQRIGESDPAVVVVILKKIEGYVREAVINCQCTPRLFVLPFPGHGNQKRYIEGLYSIVKEYIHVD